MDLTDPENLVEVVDVPEHNPEQGLLSKLSPFKSFILLLLLLLIGFVVQAKVSFDRQADFKERQDKMEKVLEKLQEQVAGSSDLRQDVKNLDDKVQKMGDSLNKRLDDLMQSDFTRRQSRGQP